MIKILKYFIITLVITGFIASFIAQKNSPWQEVDVGLSIGEFESPIKSVFGDSKFIIVKINPQFYSFKLISASEYKESNKTIEHWAKKYKLIAAVNAGMFQTDYKSNVGYMKNFNHLNNSYIHPKYYSVAAFNPKDKELPLFNIFDIDEMDIKHIIQDYETVIQNLRLIKKYRKNRWSQQAKKWSEVALGQDDDGNTLFIFSRSPFSMFDFNNILLTLPIDIVCAQHLEGGPEASLYFSHPKKEIRLNGSYETSFIESNNNSYFWPIPNIIGIVKKEGN